MDFLTYDAMLVHAIVCLSVELAILKLIEWICIIPLKMLSKLSWVKFHINIYCHTARSSKRKVEVNCLQVSVFNKNPIG